MSNVHIKVISLLLISLLLVSAGTCVLDKINTKISVFDEYESEIQRLEISAKLSYINMDSGDTNPIPGQKLNIILNVTKNTGESEETIREVMTNSGGWAKRTFYLEDVKNYDVKVTFDGSGAYKSAIGTLSGAGEYEQISYVTNLPEGISLTTCMPLLILFGFLGAAMYASGGNPFGFVDLTPSRGFRMNRNLRKSMFTQAGGFMIGGTIAKAIEGALKEASKDKETKGEGKEGEGNDGKDTKKNEGNEKVKAPVDIKKGNLLNSRQNKRVQNKPTQDNKGTKASLENKNTKTFDMGGEKLFIKTKGKTFHVLANISLILLSFVTGSGWTPPYSPGGTRDIAKRSREQIENKFKKEILKNKKIKDKKIEVDKKIIILKAQQENNNKNLAIIDKQIIGLEDKVNSLKEKLKKAEPGKKTAIRMDIRDLNKRLGNLNDERKQAVERNNTNNKERINVDKILEKFTQIKSSLKEKGLTNDEIDNMSYNSLAAMYDDKKINKEMESLMNANIINPMDEWRYNRIEANKERISELDDELKKEIDELAKLKDIKELTDKEKSKLDNLAKEKEILENNLYAFTETQQMAGAILRSEEGIDIALARVAKIEEEKEILSEKSREVNKIAAEEYKQIIEEVKRIDYLVNNEEKRKELEEIHTKVNNGEELSKKEAKEYEKYNIMFDEDRQRKALETVSATNLYEQNKPTTIDELIKYREQMKNEINNEITKVVQKSQEENFVIPKKDLEIIEKMRKDGERIAELSTDLTHQIYEAEDNYKSMKNGEYTALQTFNHLDLNRENFSKNYENFRKLHEEEKKYYNLRDEIGINTDNKYLYNDDKYIGKTEDAINQRISELPQKIYDNLEKTDYRYDKKIDERETVNQYMIMSELDKNKDEDNQLARKITNHINNEINKLGKEIKSEASTPFSTRDEDASLGRLGRLKRKEKELKELKTEIDNVIINKERDSFFESKTKIGNVKKNTEKPFDF